MNWETIENLEVLAHREGRKAAVVLFHGYGADANDLAPLQQFLDRGDSYDWFFPEGPLSTQFGGRAWYPIDERKLQMAMVTGKPRDFSGERPEGLDHASELAGELIASLRKKYDYVIWGGFSQGCILSVDVALNSSQAAPMLFLMSGTLLDEKRWDELAKKKPGQKYFQSHGQTDNILGFEGAKKLNQLLARNGWSGEFMPFQGGHEIPMPVLSKMQKSLANFVK